MAVHSAYAVRLWENDREAYKDIIRKRYYSNNAAMFYRQDKLKNLVRKLYQKTTVAEAQIPAFRSIWKRENRSDFIKKEVNAAFLDDSSKRDVYDGTLYFLLKEIYYHDFIVNGSAKSYLVQVNKQYRNNNLPNRPDRELRAENDFSSFMGGLLSRDRGLTLGGVCQSVQQEYSRQNAYQTDKEIYKHFITLFPRYMREAFILFVKENYAFLLSPEYHGNTADEIYLEEVEILHDDISDEEKQYAAWYTFAHFLHPRQLNLLIGDLKSYIQYRTDIVNREESAGQLKDNALRARANDNLKESIKRAKCILNVFEFVRGVSGRVSANFEDYYNSREEYAEYLNRYIDFERREGKTAFESLVYFCKNTLQDGAVVDIYADERNPKLLRNIEIARMYAGGGGLPVNDGLGKTIRRKVSAEEIREYYGKKDAVAAILSAGLCETAKQQEEVVQQQQLKNRLLLNDVTDIYSILNDMLGQLISMAYLRERDEMYLYLGFYYMALRSDQSWTFKTGDAGERKEYLDEMEGMAGGGAAIREGLVLYQIIAVYDFGTPMPYPDVAAAGTRWKWQGGQLALKYSRFSEAHASSFEYARRLFGENGKLGKAVNLRNYVDHSKYYAKNDKSMVDLYSEFYSLFFPYSRKLRNSVAHNFQALLERYFVDCSLKCVTNGQAAGLELDGLKSMEFTYKLKEGKGQYRCKARSEEFIGELKAVLEWKRKQVRGIVSDI